jgi:hypothetical protein
MKEKFYAKNTLTTFLPVFPIQHKCGPVQVYVGYPLGSCDYVRGSLRTVKFLQSVESLLSDGCDSGK